MKKLIIVLFLVVQVQIVWLCSIDRELIGQDTLFVKLHGAMIENNEKLHNSMWENSTKIHDAIINQR